MAQHRLTKHDLPTPPEVPVTLSVTLPVTQWPYSVASRQSAHASRCLSSCTKSLSIGTLARIAHWRLIRVTEIRKANLFSSF